MIISAIVPVEEPALLPDCVKGNEEEDCEMIGSASDLEEVDKEEVQSVLRELADLKRKEAECYEKLAVVVPEMRDSEITVVAEKVKEIELPSSVNEMYSRIGNPRDFRIALAVGERIFSQYKNKQVGTPLISIPELCLLHNVRKMKIYEIIHGGKYRHSVKEEEPEKKAPR